jgi:tRNA nucleotidyltransferase (CCA-adding enzyme)
MTQDPAVRFAVLVHDLGKAETPRDLWPRHHGHGERSAQIIDTLSKRMPVPRRFQDLADKVARHHGTAHRVAELKPATVLKLLAAVGGLRPSSDGFEAFLCACEADARGRKGLEANPYTQADLVRDARRAALSITAATVKDGTREGPELGQAIREARIDAIAALQRSRQLP